MPRFLLALLLAFWFATPVGALPSSDTVGDDANVVTIGERVSPVGGNGLLCPEAVEFGSFEQRARRLVDPVDAGVELPEASNAQPVENAFDHANDDVVQTFRAHGVRLLLFSTAPPR